MAPLEAREVWWVDWLEPITVFAMGMIIVGPIMIGMARQEQ
jgi:hypothetical protein